MHEERAYIMLHAQQTFHSMLPKKKNIKKNQPNRQNKKETRKEKLHNQFHVMPFE